MKVKKCLRDVNSKEFKVWKEKHCKELKNCSNCVFSSVNCNEDENYYWLKHKNLYSKKFLSQEIEVEVPNIKVVKPNGNILDEIEREYLKAVIVPFRNRIVFIRKESWGDCKREYIKIYLNNRDCFRLAYFKKGKKYKNMKLDKEYSIEDLKL